MMDPQLDRKSWCGLTLASLPNTRSSNFNPHASYLTLEIHSLFIRPFLAVTVDSDIRNTCEETAKLIDGNRSESGSGGDLVVVAPTLSSCDCENRDRRTS